MTIIVEGSQWVFLRQTHRTFFNGPVELNLNRANFQLLKTKLKTSRLTNEQPLEVARPDFRQLVIDLLTELLTDLRLRGRFVLTLLRLLKWK